MKTSIEVEFWVIDRDGSLTDPGDLTEISPQVEEEFVDCLFEIKTTPCESIDELRDELVGRLAETIREAKRRRKALVPLGTPINGGDIAQFPEERSRIQRRVLGEDFDYAKHCAGTHIHFEKRRIVDQLNALVALDPALALANSSPYYKGRRVAAGARPYIYRKRGYAQFPDHGQLWSYVDSVAEWNDRLTERYVEFERAALDAGIDERTFKRHFTPDDTIWTPVRLRKAYPTVEWRSPDATLPSQILRLAEEMYAVVERANESVTIEGHHGFATDDGLVLPEFDVVRELTDAAIHEGLGADRVRSYLDGMGFAVDAYDPLTERLDGQEYVGEADARSLRTTYARRLERDVARLEKGQQRV
ncbi:glutamate-cysteine ligase family protein [Halalkalicoccus jeotgali]|uniref:Glutamate--cysteine ligase GCS2 n=1 Tax=Halalkalicoccus jeotgali (strain DSM 18796 / CECT 7217 / JCM 14584 / KCTC 4019 / B3) TaxID=795797 RepID=D8JAN8_HALJB|nr:glutamate-cysteine ligase family protein [Halalkalicoccus jeotgali]ADJ14760.1 glutamate--cysteine ligase GCS2 [Halalkalicoccus jeotgali B3]ELY39342.1 glutamate--cysteine ligase GCS2 [Halalkalicoccus jeotgali B3]